MTARTSARGAATPIAGRRCNRSFDKDVSQEGENGKRQQHDPLRIRQVSIPNASLKSRKLFNKSPVAVIVEYDVKRCRAVRPHAEGQEENNPPGDIPSAFLMQELIEPK
jgi:hypothetical protein